MRDNPTRPGQIACGWWKRQLRPEQDTAPARALRARLRRAPNIVDLLAQPQVIGLYDALGRDLPPETLAALAQVLAQVRDNKDRRVAAALGTGDPRPFSPLRFQRLIRAGGPRELAQALRRALPAVDHACNVPALAEDILFWGERVRVRWCFDYYGARPPAASEPEEDE